MANTAQEVFCPQHLPINNITCIFKNYQTEEVQSHDYGSWKQKKKLFVTLVSLPKLNLKT